jgi:hypothetical protein
MNGDSVEKDLTNDSIAGRLMADKLDGYLPEKAASEAPADDPRGRAPRVRSAGRRADPYADPIGGRRPATDRRTWLDIQPALATPHVLTRQRADARMAAVRASVRLVDGRAVYDRDVWDLMVGEAVSMMLDVVEGAGLVVKGPGVGVRLRAAVDAALREDTRHWGEDDAVRPVEIR